MELSLTSQKRRNSQFWVEILYWGNKLEVSFTEPEVCQAHCQSVPLGTLELVVVSHPDG